MLSINNLSFGYPHRRHPVIQDFNLEIGTGGIYGLLGPNGSGKSTLLYLIGGLLKPQTGTVLLYGENTALRLPTAMANMYLVPEEIALPNISIKKYAEIYSPYYPRFSKEDMDTYIRTFGLEPTYKLGQLSMGQKKKAFMCFAMATNSPLMLMDEPTNGMDIDSKARFRQFIGASASDERAVIISTHQVRDIDMLLDHIIIMGANGSLLNDSVMHVSQRLAFFSTRDQTLIDRALFMAPDYNGMSIVVPNDGTMDTNINTELLYQFVTQRPDLASKILAR